MRHFLRAVYPAWSGGYSGSRRPNMAHSDGRHREGWKCADRYDVSGRVSSALDPESEARIDFVNGKPVFQLLSGVARFSLIHLRRTVGGQQQDQEAEGSDRYLDVRRHRLRPPPSDSGELGPRSRSWWEQGRSAGVGIGISEAVRGGSSVSLSQ
jgi:hypothetical protein